MNRFKNNLFVAILTFATLLVGTHAQAKSNTLCKRKMTAAKDVAYDIAYNHYMSSGNYSKSKKLGINHVKKVCRNYCRGVLPRRGGKKISCRERITEPHQLDALLSRVNFEADMKAESENATFNQGDNSTNSEIDI